MQISLTIKARRNIITNRDKTYDGVFVFAVVTTHIYCKPSCPAPRPLPQNVRFMDSIEQAKQAGFRACKRCRPDEVSTTRLQRLVTTLQSRAIEPDSTSTATGQPSLSERQLRRIISAELGATPTQVQQAARLERAKQLLAQTDMSVATIAYEVNYASLRQFNRAFKATFSVTPSAFRRQRPMRHLAATLTIIPASTPIGLFHLIADTEGRVRASGFGPLKILLDRLSSDLQGSIPQFTAQHAYQAAIDRYFAGEITALDAIPRFQPSSTFQAQVWEALTGIDYGQPQSYAQVATRIGRPRAMRAVGTACGSNRLILLVPCHRVVKNDGSTGSYLYGTAIKQYLLRHEAAARITKEEQHGARLLQRRI